MDKQLYVVDDNPDHHFMLYIILKQYSVSYKVKFFGEGKTLMHHLVMLHHAKQCLPSLIILDLNMPGANGLHLLKKLKGSLQNEPAPFRHIPVIIMSSETDPYKIQMCYKAGANAFVEKPVSFEKMKLVVKATCDFWLDVNYIPQ